MPAKNLNQVNLIGNMCSDIVIKKKNKTSSLESLDLLLTAATKAMMAMNRISFNAQYGMSSCSKKH